MKLAQNEKIIREWNYADTKQGTVKTNSKLVVTNKRIISESEDRFVVDRKEIPVSSVKSISTSNLHNSNILAYLWIIIGALGILFGFVQLANEMGEVVLPIIIIGVIAIVIGISLLNRGAFTLLIYTSALEADALAMALGRTNALAIAKKGSRIKVRIARAVVDEMLDTIGALILDIQEGVYDEVEEASEE